jgi:hypothetical protein
MRWPSLTVLLHPLTVCIFLFSFLISAPLLPQQIAKEYEVLADDDGTIPWVLLEINDPSDRNVCMYVEEVLALRHRSELVPGFDVVKESMSVSSSSSSSSSSSMDEFSLSLKSRLVEMDWRGKEALVAPLVPMNNLGAQPYRADDGGQQRLLQELRDQHSAMSESLGGNHRRGGLK